jgi:hypothetical protein
MPSTMKRFSEPLAPSTWMPPAYASWLVPGAWLTTDVKSRPRGIFSMISLLTVAKDAFCLTSISGDSPVTSTVSESPPTAMREVDLQQLPQREDRLGPLRGEPFEGCRDGVDAGRQRREPVDALRVAHRRADANHRRAARLHGHPGEDAPGTVLDHPFDRSALLLRKGRLRDEEQRQAHEREHTPPESHVHPSSVKPPRPTTTTTTATTEPRSDHETNACPGDVQCSRRGPHDEAVHSGNGWSWSEWRTLRRGQQTAPTTSDAARGEPDGAYYKRESRGGPANLTRRRRAVSAGRCPAAAAARRGSAGPWCWGRGSWERCRRRASPTARTRRRAARTRLPGR